MKKIILSGLFTCCYYLSMAQTGILFVDNSLPSEITDGSYSIENRDNSGADGNAYVTIQAAINAMEPGNIIYLRGGTYHETHIDLTVCRHGLPEAKNTLKSYPGEWAIVDGQYQDPGYFRPSVFWGTGGAGMSYWVFEDMEITGGGHPSENIYLGAGIYLESPHHCEFRRLYVHDNYMKVNIPGHAGGLILDKMYECLVEYCYLKGNGNPMGERNTANANISYTSDYKYENEVDPETCTHKNIIRYNLLDGDCLNATGGYTPIAIMQKGMQRLTGYVYGETGNPSDLFPNDVTYRDYGDNIHHNIIINSPYGLRLDQDYVQVHHNIIWLTKREDVEIHRAIGVRDYYSNRRGPVYTCVYNNTVYADDGEGITFRIIPDGYDAAVDPPQCVFGYGFAVNNIICHAMGGYDWSILSFEGSGIQNAGPGEVLVLENFNVSGNLFNNCTGNNGEDVIRFADRNYTAAQIILTPAADRGWKNNETSIFKGSSGAEQYQSIDYSLDVTYSIANAGIGGGHPFLSGTNIPEYIGATDPYDDSWVNDVLDLKKLGDISTGAPAIKRDKNISVFPNPANEHITVLLGNFYKNISIEIINNTGQCVMKKQLRNVEEVNLSVKKLSSGPYFLRIKFDGEIRAYKLLKTL